MEFDRIEYGFDRSMVFDRILRELIFAITTDWFFLLGIIFL